LSARNVTVTNPDTGSGAGAGVFTVFAPSITIGLSTLGYSDALRDTVAPFAVGFGPVISGEVRQIGPAASGQTTPGTAFEVTRTADTDSILRASLTDFSNGGDTAPAGSLAWRINGMAGAWTPFTTAGATVDAAAAPGTIVKSYDVQLTVPGAQAGGAYAATMTWTAVAVP
jgi:hypothetical protein